MMLSRIVLRSLRGTFLIATSQRLEHGLRKAWRPPPQPCVGLHTGSAHASIGAVHADATWAAGQIGGQEEVWHSPPIFGALPEAALPGAAQESHIGVECDVCGQCPVLGAPLGPHPGLRWDGTAALCHRCSDAALDRSCTSWTVPTHGVSLFLHMVAYHTSMRQHVCMRMACANVDTYDAGACFKSSSREDYDLCYKCHSKASARRHDPYRRRPGDRPPPPPPHLLSCRRSIRRCSIEGRLGAAQVSVVLKPGSPNPFAMLESICAATFACGLMRMRLLIPAMPLGRTAGGSGAQCAGNHAVGMGLLHNGSSWPPGGGAARGGRQRRGALCPAGPPCRFRQQRCHQSHPLREAAPVLPAPGAPLRGWGAALQEPAQNSPSLTQGHCTQSCEESYCSETMIKFTEPDRVALNRSPTTQRYVQTEFVTQVVDRCRGTAALSWA